MEIKYDTTIVKRKSTIAISKILYLCTPVRGSPKISLNLHKDILIFNKIIYIYDIKHVQVPKIFDPSFAFLSSFRHT